MKKKIQVMFLLFFIVSMLTNVLNYYGMNSVRAASDVKLNITKKVLFKGQTVKLKLNPTTKTVKWSSSNQSAASVKNGIVTARKKGTAAITAKCENEECSCKIIVQEPKLNKSVLSLKAGETAQLELKDTNITVKWKSGNGNTATVKNGKVTAVTAGETTITAVCNKKNFNCVVTVKPAGVSESGQYTSKEEVAMYIHLYKKLPDNFITKKEANALGWTGGSLEPYAPGKSIGGDYFGNYEGILPDTEGCSYKECDIDTKGADSRGQKESFIPIKERFIIQRITTQPLHGYIPAGQSKER